ncbi:MAG: hypothetical protein LLG44_04250 [Chloroflexi bacterium]|nr:hypothetical protein [Chloroflexota bacterium]
MLGLYLGLCLLAGASLGLEITLTRVFALGQWYHFAFVAISMALLGYAAGGTVLSVFPRLLRQPRKTAASSASAGALSMLGGYLVANNIPFDAYRIASDPLQFLYLAVYYAVLALPFFWVSMGTGVLLTAFQKKSNQVYAANLLGSAAGCALAPLALAWVGGAGSVAIFAGLAALAALVFAWERPLEFARLVSNTVVVIGCMFLATTHPAWFDVRLSPYKELPQTLQAAGAKLIWQRWDASSRVDIVDSPTLHAAPGMSLSCKAPEPAQRAAFVDGDNPSPLLSGSPESLRAWSECLPLALPYHLRPNAKTLILEPGGNLDVQVAQSFNAAQVTVVEHNKLLVDAADGYPGATVAVETDRTFLRRSDELFDVIDIALSGSRNVVSVGAYSLSEEYRYTVEAVEDALARLSPDGILVMSRWLQSPPSEELRAWSLAVAALSNSGVNDIGGRLAAIRSWSTILILVKNGTFTTKELGTIREFCSSRQFDLVYLPDLKPEEANRYNVFPHEPYLPVFIDMLDPAKRSALYASQEYDISPPTDDHPFFFHFFTWKQVPAIIDNLGHTWKPFGGSGYLVLVAHLAVAIIAGILLAILPAAFRKERKSKLRLRIASYFGLLGIGYLAVEIPLVQRFILFLGNPTRAFAAVVANLLFFSGIGSLLARRIHNRWIILGLVVAIIIIGLGLEPLFGALIGASLTIRLLVTSLVLAPLGVLLGMPFPYGLAWLESKAPELVPWAWAVNGSLSVVTSVGVAMAALTVGFTEVFAAAIVVYTLAALVVDIKANQPSADR